VRVDVIFTCFGTVKGRPIAEKGATYTPKDKRNGGTRHGVQATHNKSKNRRDTARKKIMTKNFKKEIFK
jgi:hypothetical protein